MDNNPLLPEVHFGEVTNTPVDWRKAAQAGEVANLDDDVELAETPPDVIAMLGFDPLEFSGE